MNRNWTAIRDKRHGVKQTDNLIVENMGTVNSKNIGYVFRAINCTDKEFEENTRIILNAPHVDAELQKLKSLVFRMRDAQNKYFRTKTGVALTEAKKLESIVDRLVADSKPMDAQLNLIQ